MKTTSLIENVGYPQLGKPGTQRVGTSPKLRVRIEENVKLL